MGEGLPVEDSNFHLLAFPRDLILFKNKYYKVAIHQKKLECHMEKCVDCKG